MDITEGVDLAYWWIFIGGGSAINGATPSSFMIGLTFELKLITTKIDPIFQAKMLPALVSFFLA